MALGAALPLTAIALAGCGGGGGDDELVHGPGVELAARLPSDDALNIAIADVTAIRKHLDMKPHSIPPTDDDGADLAFLDEIGAALGIVSTGTFPQPIVDAALRRAGWIAGVAGDQGVTAISIGGNGAGLRSMLAEAGLQEEDGEWVQEDGDYAIALGDGLIVFADDPGDAKPVIEDDPDDVPDQLAALDGDGDLITLARFGADCVEAVGTADTPGEDGEVAFFTTATPDPDKITSDSDEIGKGRVVGDSARAQVAAAADPAGEPPALRAVQQFDVHYDCDA